MDVGQFLQFQFSICDVKVHSSLAIVTFPFDEMSQVVFLIIDVIFTVSAKNYNFFFLEKKNYIARMV